jgi:hypothetical protein
MDCGKHMSHDRYQASLLVRWSDLQKTQLPLLLRVGLCLQSCCLATVTLHVSCNNFERPQMEAGGRFPLVFCSAYSTLKIEALCFFETSFDLQ